MRMRSIKWILGVFLFGVWFAVVPLSPAADLSLTRFLQPEFLRIATTDRVTQAPRSQGQGTVQIESVPDRRIYRLQQSGQGDIFQYKAVTWQIESELEETMGFLQPLRTRYSIYDQSGQALVRWEVKYDYSVSRITILTWNAQGQKFHDRTFPIKGRTADSSNLIYFLRAYVANRTHPDYQRFYLLSSEPALYRINIKVIKEEELALANGKIKAVKLRLIPDFGVFSNGLSPFVPPTFIWFESDPPYRWLRYEGLENGLRSANIRAQAVDYR